MRSILLYIIAFILIGIGSFVGMTELTYYEVNDDYEASKFNLSVEEKSFTISEDIEVAKYNNRVIFTVNETLEDDELVVRTHYNNDILNMSVRKQGNQIQIKSNLKISFVGHLVNVYIDGLRHFEIYTNTDNLVEGYVEYVANQKTIDELKNNTF